MDPQVVSVGITQMANGFGFRVVRWRRPGVAALRELDARACSRGVRGVPVAIVEALAAVRPLVQIPASAPRPSASQTMIFERGPQRPLCPGLQLQNYDADVRAGLIAADRMEVGTLGMTLERGGETLIVSNHHVLAGHGHGLLGDRIAQPGGATLREGEVIATLERAVELLPSATNAHPMRGDVIWNRVDAAAARLRRGVAWQAEFMDHHRLPRLGKLASPVIGEEVFKVGRTTGLRRGRIASVRDRVGPIGYGVGPVWFRGSFTVEGLRGRSFSEPGDSGAIVVRRSGEVLGMIYAGNGVQTYACPITDVFDELGY